MCEILGINSNIRFTANEVLRRFYDESKDHPDGWGLAVFRSSGVSWEKEAVQASKSRYLSQRLSKDIASENLLAHIRRASIGSIEYANCHPFVWDDITGRTWTLVHNGTFFDPDLITPYFPLQEGTTDSEAMLLCMLDRINNKTREKNGLTEGDDLPVNKNLEPLTFEERFEIIDHAVSDLSGDNKLNLLIFDGEVMYAHTNLQGTLFETCKDGTRIIATKPLTFDEWQPVPMMQLQAYQKGERIKSGTMHGKEFFTEEHDMGEVYLTYAAL